MITITSNVPLPKSKHVKRSNEKRRRIFATFAKVYQQLYIIEPDRYSMDRGLMVIYAGNRVCERADEHRIKQLTRMMRERLATR